MRLPLALLASVATLGAVVTCNAFAVFLWERTGDWWPTLLWSTVLWSVIMPTVLAVTNLAAKDRAPKPKPKSPEDEKWERLLRVRE